MKTVYLDLTQYVFVISKAWLLITKHASPLPLPSSVSAIPVLSGDLLCKHLPALSAVALRALIYFSNPLNRKSASIKGCPTLWRLWATLGEEELLWATHEIHKTLMKTDEQKKGFK